MRGKGINMNNRIKWTNVNTVIWHESVGRIPSNGTALFRMVVPMRANKPNILSVGSITIKDGRVASQVTIRVGTPTLPDMVGWEVYDLLQWLSVDGNEMVVL